MGGCLGSSKAQKKENEREDPISFSPPQKESYGMAVNSETMSKDTYQGQQNQYKIGCKAYFQRRLKLLLIGPNLLDI